MTWKGLCERAILYGRLTEAQGGRPSLLVAPTPSKSKVAAKRRRQLGKQ